MMRLRAWKGLRSPSLSCFLGALLAVSNVPPAVEAQGLFEGRLPRLFNREQPDPERPQPVTRDSPDIVFFRDYGIPTPRSVKIETIKGLEVSFYIGAETTTRGMTVEFLVREFPTAGKILSIISDRNHRNTAAVTYYADPDSGATMDTFTFVARYPGGKFSTPARCDIKILETQSLIEAEAEEANFGPVMVGSGAEREIVVRNKGSAPYAAPLSLPPPWTVMSPPGGQLAIPPGGQAKIKIGFAPTFSGPAVYDVHFGSGEKGTCKLTGEGIVPFSYQSEEWEMAVNPQTGRREASIVVLNHHSRPLEAYLRTSTRLRTAVQGMFYLIPGKENVIEVYLPEDDVADFDGGIQIKLKEGFSSTAKVTGGTVPARLKVEIPGQLSHEVINFGQIYAGRSVERGLILKNAGGELLALDAEVEEPFRILTRMDRQLVPLESYPVSIGFYPGPEARGAANGLLTLFSKDQAVQIRLVGNALRPPNAPRDPLPSPGANRPLPPELPSPAPGEGVSPTVAIPSPPVSPLDQSPDRIAPSLPPPAPQSKSGVARQPGMWAASLSREEFLKSLSPMGIPTRALVERELSADLRAAEDFQLVKASSDRLELSWTAPKDSETETFELEMRAQHTDPVSRICESVWAPYPDVTYKRVGRLVKAVVSNLTPDALYEFRVITVNLNGRCSPPSVAFVVRTTRTMDWTYIYLGLGALLLALLGYGIFKVIQKRRPEAYRSPVVE